VNKSIRYLQTFDDPKDGPAFLAGYVASHVVEPADLAAQLEAVKIGHAEHVVSVIGRDHQGVQHALWLSADQLRAALNELEAVASES